MENDEQKITTFSYTGDAIDWVKDMPEWKRFEEHCAKLRISIDFRPKFIFHQDTPPDKAMWAARELMKRLVLAAEKTLAKGVVLLEQEIKKAKAQGRNPVYPVFKSNQSLSVKMPPAAGSHEEQTDVQTIAQKLTSLGVAIDQIIEPGAVFLAKDGHRYKVTTSGDTGKLELTDWGEAQPVLVAQSITRRNSVHPDGEKSEHAKTNTAGQESWWKSQSPLENGYNGGSDSYEVKSLISQLIEWNKKRNKKKTPENSAQQGNKATGSKDYSGRIIKGDEKPLAAKDVLELSAIYAQGPDGGMANFLNQELKINQPAANNMSNITCVTESLFITLAAKGYAAKTKESFVKYMKLGFEEGWISPYGGLLEGEKLANAYGAKYKTYTAADGGYSKYLEAQSKTGEFFMVRAHGYYHTKDGLRYGAHTSTSIVTKPGEDIAADTGWSKNRGKKQSSKPEIPVLIDEFESITIVE
jgi:hypothetical protein